MTPKKLAVYTLLIIIVVFTFIFAFFRPNVTITFNQNSVLTPEEKNEITSIVNRQYKENLRHIGSTYTITFDEPRELINPEKRTDYTLIVWGSVKAAEVIDSTGTGESNWRLALAKDKVGHWNLVGDVLCCAQGEDWY